MRRLLTVTLATGHAAFAGSAEAAFKATDSSSGTLLAESVDKRIGGMAVANAAQIQWGDAEAAMDYWSLHITQRAVTLGAGTPGSSQPACGEQLAFQTLADRRSATLAEAWTRWHIDVAMS